MVNCTLSTKERQQVLAFLEEFHDVFSVTEGERGETSLVEMEIDTGDSRLKKQAAWRMPFAVRNDVALHLQKMLKQKVIQSSNSTWASPVVLVQKKMAVYGSVWTIEVLIPSPSQTDSRYPEYMTCLTSWGR